jgi:hypothetical protein
MIRYKYPENIRAGKSHFPRFKEQPLEQRVSFNYDDFRKQIRAEKGTLAA